MIPGRILARRTGACGLGFRVGEIGRRPVSTGTVLNCQSSPGNGGRSNPAFPIRPRWQSSWTTAVRPHHPRRAAARWPAVQSRTLHRHPFYDGPAAFAIGDAATRWRGPERCGMQRFSHLRAGGTTPPVAFGAGAIIR